MQHPTPTPGRLRAALFNIVAPGAGYLHLGRGWRAIGYALLIAAFWSAAIDGLDGLMARHLVLYGWAGLFVVAILLMIADVARLRGPRSTPARWYASWPAPIIAILAWIGAHVALDPTRGDFAIRTFAVASGSMAPALLPGDRIAADMTAFHRRAPARGDIVVLMHPRRADDIYIKRIIALPGETVEIRDGIVFVDGRPAMVEPVVPLPSPEAADGRRGDVWRETLPGAPPVETLHTNVKSPLRTVAPRTVPADHYFVLGDNRDDSLDSRSAPERGGLGMVPRDRIIGAATWVYWSAHLARIGATLR